jgi:hypothetical protein
MPTGPLYCETGHALWFMAEPINTLTNAFIIIAGIYAWRAVSRARIGMPFDLAVLLFLLFATGIGSFAWHAFRTRIALAFDALPGLLFLFVFAGLWFRVLWGNLAGIAGALGLIALAVGVTALWRHFTGNFYGMPMAFAFIPAFASVAAIGLFLAAVTARRFGSRPARIGAFAILCGVTAAVCRSIDLLTCSVIPTGTHFLWHMLLSLAAYLGIVMLTELKSAREA